MDLAEASKDILEEIDTKQKDSKSTESFAINNLSNGNDEAIKIPGLQIILNLLLRKKSFLFFQYW